MQTAQRSCVVLGDTWSTRGLHVVYTWSTRGLHVVCTWSTRGLHVVARGRARSRRGSRIERVQRGCSCVCATCVMCVFESRAVPRRELSSADGY